MSARGPRRVLYANAVPRWGGGAEAALLELATALDRAEFEPLLVTTEEGTLAERWRASGIETVVIPPGYVDKRRGRLEFYVTGPPALRALLRRHAVDLVHTNDNRSIAPFVRAARRLGVPAVCHIMDMDRPWFSRRNRPALRRAAAVVAISRAIADHALRRGTPADRLRVIYLGVDPAPYRAAASRRAAARRALGLGDGDFAVGLFGHLVARKGQAELLEAAADPSLAELPVRYFLVGEDWRPDRAFERELRGRAAALRAPGAVAFLGHRDDVPALMAAMDVTAAPFRNEGFGRVVVESMAAGTPVVGYRSGALPELVREYRDGLLVEPGDTAALAAALGSLAVDAPLRGRLAASARVRAEEFSRARHVAAMRALYLEALGGAAR